MKDHGKHFNRAVAEAGLVLLAEVGSTVHGVNLAGSDDLDLQGMCIESPGILLGHRTFEQCITRTHADGTPIPNGERSGPGDTDRTVYSLRKWTSLAVKGNPTALLPLFVPDYKLHYVNAWGYELRSNRELFLSKQCAYAFRGFLRRQQLNAFSDAKHTNRPELVQLYGFDTKAAYHAMRLAIQGKELVTEHQITLPMPNGWTDVLKMLRRGEIPKDEAMTMLDHLVSALDSAVEHSDLPNKPDLNVIDVWVTGMYKTFWKERSWV